MKWLPKPLRRRLAKHEIDINWSELSPPMRNYVFDVIDLATDNDVRVLMPNTRSVDMDDHGGKCNGYVDEDPRVLATACGQPVTTWFRTFVHESCHMDQLIERDPLWFEVGCIHDVETAELLDLWLNHKIELTDQQKWNVIGPVRDLELDCERRALRKIEKYHLPIGPNHYARQANSYIQFYNIMCLTRKWYSIGREPYNIKLLVNRMPTDLDGDYTTLAPNILADFIRFMPEMFTSYNVK